MFLQEWSAPHFQGGIAIANDGDCTFGRNINVGGKTETPGAAWITSKMKSSNQSPDSAIGSQPSSGGILWFNVAVFALCLGFYFAEQQGFRVFDKSLHGTHSGEFVVPSPLEVLLLVGAISLGVWCGLFALMTSIVWLIRHVRGSHGATTGEGYASSTANSPVHHGMS